jgi:acetyl-CoA carboxylase biotin carboxylase subunit
MRKAMTDGAVNLFDGLDYAGAGTIEFLVEDGAFYFMEVNARVQVEHPVSEMTTGVDVIKEQIHACAEGWTTLPHGPRAVSGHALECRINALSPGRIERLEIPGGPGVRFDSFLYTGCTVPPYYDSMIAKLIVHGADRAAVVAKMDGALRELVIEGVKTNAAEQRAVINDRLFQAGTYSTKFIEEFEKRR